MMGSQINISIDENEYPIEWGLSSAAYEGWIVSKLREAGIPVDGMLMFKGVKYGTLVWRKEWESPQKIDFTWNEGSK